MRRIVVLLVIALVILIASSVTAKRQGPRSTKPRVRNQPRRVVAANDQVDEQNFAARKIRYYTETEQVKPQTDTSKTKTLLIGSFNIQVFGVKKLQDENVVNVLLRTLSRYDVCLVQEIRDNTETAIFTLLARLNAFNEQNPKKRNYQLVVSERLGRSVSKEQYAYIYDANKVKVIQTYQFNHTNAYGWFERPPYSAIFQPVDGIKILTTKPHAAAPYYMWFMGVHISPGKAVSEIERMADVYNDYLDNPYLPIPFKDTLINRYVMMGDLNAGCSYVNKAQLAKLKNLAPKPSATNGPSLPFAWLISDQEDTTVSTNAQCPYDRFISTNPILTTESKVRILEDSVTTFNFREAYNLSEELAKKVSDHYPIEMTVEYKATTL